MTGLALLLAGIAAAYCGDRLYIARRRGSSIKTRWFLYHPHSYGIATLMRIGFRFRGRGLYLHHFRPHAEDEFHDHPWPFRTLVLWGGYVDDSLVRLPNDEADDLVDEWHQRPDIPITLLHEFLGVSWEDYAAWVTNPDHPLMRVYRDVLRPGSGRSRPALHAHRTSCKSHTWTVVLTGKKERDWCKGTPGKWICDGEVEDFDATRGMVKVR